MRKVNAFRCKQASNASSPCFRHSDLFKKPLSDTWQQCSTSPANHEPRLPANGVFKIQGFVCKRFLPSFPSPPLPPSFFFRLSPPAQAKYRKSRSSVFLCSQTPRKRLLRRLQTPQNLVISRCCFAQDGKEMYNDL